MALTIAVLGGTGPEGFGLALRWVQAGESVIIGSRDAKRAQDAAEKITQRVGANAKIAGDENISACMAADLLVLTIPFEGHAALLKQIKPVIRPGSIVIDAHRTVGRQRRRSCYPHSRRVAGFSGATDRRTRAERNPGRGSLSECRRRPAECGKPRRLRCHRMQRRSRCQPDRVAVSHKNSRRPRH